MTVNRDIFMRGLSVMQDFFGRSFEPPTIAVLYGAIGPVLSDAEFERAVRLTIASERFFPPVDVFLAKVRPPVDLKLEAEREFERVLDACHDLSWQQAMTKERFSPAVFKSVNAAGGIRAVALAEPDAAPHNRRRFIEHYITVVGQDVTEYRAVSGSLDPRAQQLVEQTVKQIGGSR